MIPQRVVLAKAGRLLLWRDWGEGDFSVYQVSSSETHFFNYTTKLMLKLVESAPASIEEISEFLAVALSANVELSDIRGAVGRLEELGLIEWFDEVPNCP